MRKTDHNKTILWTELNAFDPQSPDCGAAEYIKLLGFTPQAVSLFVFGSDFVHQHDGMAEDRIFPPDIGFYLDMLTEHIESAGFHRQNIIFKSRRRCGKENSVAEVPLIKYPMQKIRLTIQCEERSAVYLGNPEGTHSKIGIYFVLAAFQGEIVKIRILG